MRNALQHAVTHCNTLQHTATHSDTLQQGRASIRRYGPRIYTATHCVCVCVCMYVGSVCVCECEGWASIRRYGPRQSLNNDLLEGVSERRKAWVRKNFFTDLQGLLGQGSHAGPARTKARKKERKNHNSVTQIHITSLFRRETIKV